MALIFFGDPVIDVMVSCSEEFLARHGIHVDNLGGSELMSQRELDDLRRAACADSGVPDGGDR